MASYNLTNPSTAHLWNTLKHFGRDEESDEPQGQWHDGVQCFVIAVTHHWDTHVGLLTIRAQNSTDMRGTINLFEAIDPLIERIYVIRGVDMDIVYERLGGDKWRAESHRG